MYLIIGLGNPESKYDGTRHNLGFVFVEKLAKKLKVGKFALNKKLKSQIVKSGEVVIAKPQTFVNLSGEAVLALKSYFKTDFENIIVISDDCNLEVGQARIRFSGSDGGHNGLKSVISSVGNDFWRVRIGIGQNGPVPLEKYVLQGIPASDAKKINVTIDKTIELLVRSISQNKLENETLN